MKATCSALLLVLVLPLSLDAQDRRPIQVSAFAGVFSPRQDDLQDIYGDGLIGKVGIAYPLQTYGRLRLAVSRFQKDGDPFFQSRDFSGGDVGTLAVTGFSLSLETHILTPDNPRLHFGGGVDYFLGREKIVGNESSTGGAVGAHLSVSPEVRVNDRLSILAEATYRFVEVTFRSGRSRFDFDLSGAALMLGLGYSL